MNFRYIIVVLVALALFGCSTPRHQQGGAASTSLPQMVKQDIKQPENPEGSSRIAFEERATTHFPDGRIQIHERKSATDIGGSQDLANIIKAVSSIDFIRSLFTGAMLLFIAYALKKRDWPITSYFFLAGGIASFIWPWWAGIGVAAFGVAMAYGWNHRSAIIKPIG